MAWSTPKTWGYKETLSSSDLNTYVRDNLIYLKSTVFPVGAIYISVVSTSPATLFGGTWSAFATGRVLVGIDTNDADFVHAEHEAGGKTHSHTTGGISANHQHSGGVHPSSNETGGYGLVQSSGFVDRVGITGDNTGSVTSDHTHSAGSGVADSTVQPSIAVYMWKRTA